MDTTPSSVPIARLQVQQMDHLVCQHGLHMHQLLQITALVVGVEDSLLASSFHTCVAVITHTPPK